MYIDTYLKDKQNYLKHKQTKIFLYFFKQFILPEKILFDLQLNMFEAASQGRDKNWLFNTGGCLS